MVSLQGLELRRALAEQVCDRTLERGQPLVDFDHLVRADGIHRVNIGMVLRPLDAALTAVEYIALVVGAVDVGRRILELPAADALAPIRFQLRRLLQRRVP